MNPSTSLSGSSLRSAAAPWLDELGKQDRERLQKLLVLADTERLPLSVCLSQLFPQEKDLKKAQAALTSFRKRINDASKGEGRADLGLRFHVDTLKQNPPHERFCWFTGADPAITQVERYSDQLTADIQGKPLVPTQGLATTGAALASGKRAVRFFVSYAHADGTHFSALLKLLRTELASSRKYEVSLWTDREIRAGSEWKSDILGALHACDFGLVLLSPAFLASNFIGMHELPHFVNRKAGAKPHPVIPVGLIPVSFEKQDLQGLEAHQIFMNQTDKSDGRFFDQVPTGPKKREFVHNLFLAIEKRLDSFFAPPPPHPPSGPQGLDARSEDALARHLPVPDATSHFQKTRGHRIALGDLERLDNSKPALSAQGEPRDALGELESWATSTHPDSPPFFALLGEYGIGKTTTLKQFTRHMLERRKSEPGLPLPIYVDLRDYSSKDPDTVPTIEQLLASVIERSWKLSERGVSPRDVLRLVREEGAVILFDGLDEKIVHLPPRRAREFIRTLWAVLPDAARQSTGLPEGKRRGKLLISCRSHYFRDVVDQNSMLVGEDREGLDRKQFPALCLLPFTEEQIRAYLESFLGSKEHSDKAFDVIASIHNLGELAERPYLLSLISGRLGELEQLKLRGEKVNAARLYELVVKSWLNRDDGKHQLEPAHKVRLMEELAAAMWRTGTQKWTVDRLETWLDEYLAASPTLLSIYAQKDRAVLKEDLRTATFVLRPTREEKHFRFAHTSLQEYFIAAHLARALAEGKLERWDLPRVSRETLDFLGQILDAADQPEAMRSLEAILGGDVLQAAVRAFAYWLRALEMNFPVPVPSRVKLAGANLEGWHLRGRSPSQLLNLRGADLSGVKLNHALLENVNFSEANLTGVAARQALFLQVSAPRAKAQGADLRGMRWREGSLVETALGAAQLDGCQWILVDLTGSILPEGWEHQASTVSGKLTSALFSTATPRLLTRSGHASPVNACAWSPDSRRLLSGSSDNSLKVWDASSGECLLTLSGHTSTVNACAWSPDGRLLLSGSSENLLKVWDASSGECQLTLRGHTSAVNACAWSPDGRRLLSGSYDHSLKVWDASSGECLLTLSGHHFTVNACAWSPDGRRLLSGSDDTSLKMWDSSSGQCLLDISGHDSPVTACAWSPDGRRLLSGYYDNSLKVWDAPSGKCLLTLSGHAFWVNACAWSPDGRHILSGSGDNSLKVWDAVSGECLLTLSGHTSTVSACAWSPDNRCLLSSSSDNSLKVWAASSGECLLNLSGNTSRVSACGWSPDGHRFLSGSSDNSLKVWDTSSGQCLLTLSGHSASVNACAWSPGGRRLLSGSSDNSLKVWDADSGKCLLSLGEHAFPVTACAWSPDGRRMLSGSSDNCLKVWHASSGECLLTLLGHLSTVTACAWSPDSSRILSGSDDNSLMLWDVFSGKCLLTLSGHDFPVTACAWSPDSHRIVSGSFDNSLKVWNASSGECLLTLSGHTSKVTACAWSPDGRRLLSSSFDNSLKVWDASSGECLFTLSGHASKVTACAWSPGGRRLLSGSFDNSLKVWEASSSQCLWSGYLLPGGQTASIDEAQGRCLHASPEAWRWLGYRWTDPVTGRMRILPAETFGPLAA